MSTNQISTPFKGSNVEQDKIKLKDWIIHFVFEWRVMKMPYDISLHIFSILSTCVLIYWLTVRLDSKFSEQTYTSEFGKAVNLAYGQGGLKLEINIPLQHISAKSKGGLIIEGGVSSSEYGTSKSYMYTSNSRAIQNISSTKLQQNGPLQQTLPLPPKQFFSKVHTA